MTNEEILSQLEGSKLTLPQTQTQPLCDTCSQEIDQGDTLTIYYADRDFRDDFPDRLAVKHIYCSECARSELLCPIKGVTEYLVRTEVVDDDWSIENVRIIDESSSKEGIPWNVEQVWNTFYTNISFERFVQSLNPRERYGPESVSDALLQAGVDLREVLDDNGTIAVPEGELAELREQVKRDIQQADGANDTNSDKGGADEFEVTTTERDGYVLRQVPPTDDAPERASVIDESPPAQNEVAREWILYVTEDAAHGRVALLQGYMVRFTDGTEEQITRQMGHEVSYDDMPDGMAKLIKDGLSLNALAEPEIGG